MRIEDHMEITNYAVDLYWMFSSTDMAEKYRENVKEIQEGARSAGNRIMQSGARNLHYYNRGNRLKPRKIKLLGLIPLYTLYPSSEHCLRGYINELEQQMAQGMSADTYVLIGKILHLVQDVSSPTHVAPILHSFNSRDSFEDRLNSRIKLYISNYTLSQDGFNQICHEQERQREPQCIEWIYQDAANRTIDYISDKKSRFEVKVDGEITQGSWQLFWLNHEHMQSGTIYGKRPKFHGFGGYGPLGKHFGHERVTAFRKEYEIPRNVYEGLSHFVVRKSIEDSIRILNCIGKQIEQLRQ